MRIIKVFAVILYFIFCSIKLNAADVQVWEHTITHPETALDPLLIAATGLVSLGAGKFGGINWKLQSGSYASTPVGRWDNSYGLRSKKWVKQECTLNTVQNQGFFLEASNNTKKEFIPALTKYLIDKRINLYEDMAEAGEKKDLYRVKSLAAKIREIGEEIKALDDIKIDRPITSPQGIDIPAKSLIIFFDGDNGSGTPTRAIILKVALNIIDKICG